MSESTNHIALSILVTVVSGKASLRQCLASLVTQKIDGEIEIIVPYDRFCPDVATLANEFPDVLFHEITNLGRAEDTSTNAHQHCLFDRRRAVGLELCRGRIIAITEDHALPTQDWCAQIMTCHTQPYAAIGGAIENGVDRPMNWAWYYCDFGRYGRPMEPAACDYISDVNIAYKREALEAVREAWQDEYHETTVHWMMQEQGHVTFRDPRMVVMQHRPKLSLIKSIKERWQWAGVYAETRLQFIGFSRRMVLLMGGPLLPAVLTMRATKNMLRQGRGLRQMLTAIPLVLLLTTAWSAGECYIYLVGPPPAKSNEVTHSR